MTKVGALHAVCFGPFRPPWASCIQRSIKPQECLIVTPALSFCQEVMSLKKVAVIMGSDSDFPVVKGALVQLKKFGVPFEAKVLSAHRTPAQAEEFARTAEENGFGVIIAAAGKAAHLGGVLAAQTVLPVIGLPIKSSFCDGLDSLLSIVQMPSGIPVATVGVNAADNAGLLAIQMLALSDEGLARQLREYKRSMAEAVLVKDENLQMEVAKL